MKPKKENKRVYRLPPCPDYDVEGMESWLSDLGKEGLFLAKDGFFAGVAAFERGKPAKVKYRLEAAQKSTSMWADDMGEPDPDQIELSEKYDWTYLGKRGDFYIYRSFDPKARELNTDPEVQALALNAVKKRWRGSLFTLIFWLVVYPLLWIRGGVLLTIIHVKTWLFLLATLFVLWVIVDSVAGLVSLGKLQKKLRQEGKLSSSKNWRRRQKGYFLRKGIGIVWAAALIFFFLQRFGVSITDEDKIPLAEYTGTLPFATMADFGEGEVTSYQQTMLGMNMGFNCLSEWSDWLSPRCIDYGEHARIVFSDGEVIDGGLYVDYYETAHPLIARWLAEECYRVDRREEDFALLETPKVDGDFVAAYQGTLHFPTILIQRGNIVIRAYFYQTGGDPVSFETWSKIIAESVGEK